VIREDEEAQKFFGLAIEAYDVLKGQTNRLVGRGIMAPMEF
jgi:hypothetical protein